MSEHQLLNIPVKSIRDNPVALRNVNRQSEEYVGLVESIKQRGVLNAIVVRELPSQDGEKLYGLVDGLHRYTASVDAGLVTIPAQVINMDDAATMEAQLIGNAHKIETKPVEYSKHLQRILASNPLMTMTVLAGKLAKTTSWLSERLGLLKLSKEIASLVDEGKINLSNAYSLAKLPTEEQVNFVERAMSMTPQEFTPTVLARKKEIDTAKRQGRDAKPAEFIPIAHLQKMSTLKEEIERPTVGPLLCRQTGVKTAEEGFALGLRWATHLDPNSIEQAKAKEESRKKDLEQKKIKAQAERAKKKADEAAQAAAGLQTA